MNFRSVLFLILGSCCLFSFEATSSPSIIAEKSLYGEDNRALISDLNESLFSKEIKMGRAVLAQIPKWRISFDEPETFGVEATNLEHGLNVCSDEKFSDLPLIASCSAFLVAQNMILTAGHCIKSENECKNNVWILDYDSRMSSSGIYPQVFFNKEKMVTCKKVIKFSYDSKKDFALIEIDRKLMNRQPLKMRRSGHLKLTDSLEVIGHPLGLPKILANKARVLELGNGDTFKTDADTFSGNSGSPVINSKTMEVEGILIKGSEDFRLDPFSGCNRALNCQVGKCIGETVLKTNALDLGPIPKF